MGGWPCAPLRVSCLTDEQRWWGGVGSIFIFSYAFFSFLHSKTKTTGMVMQAQTTGVNPLENLKTHLRDPMGTTIFNYPGTRR